MNHTGTVYLSRTPPLATTAACGVFQLELLVYDRLGNHHVEPWRVTWSGQSAQRFWDEYKCELTPGRALVVSLERARIHSLVCRPPRNEMLANVLSCALVPARSKEAACA